MMQIEVQLDTASLDRAVQALTAALGARTVEACRQTATAIAREAQARLSRQLKAGSSGETVAGIMAVPTMDGYLVVARNRRMPNLPLWLEKGTNPGRRKNFARVAPRPFFYASVTLEAQSHARRLREAMQTSATDAGLGA